MDIGFNLLLSMIGNAAGHLFGLCLKVRQIAGGVISDFILSFTLLSNKAGEFPRHPTSEQSS